jgi:hypothetical protein
MLIISLRHTRRHDKCITFWRPDNKGYTWLLKDAGNYETPVKGYHDNDDNMPIKRIKALNLSISDEGNDKELKVPNIKMVWDALNVKMTKNGLVKQ